MLDRLLDIYRRYSEHLRGVTPLVIEEGFLKCILHLPDGTNLRVAEEWREGRLVRYSYYWLSPDHALLIGWDNAPHHPEIASHPHHKHVHTPSDRQPSTERSLEDVLEYILAHPRSA